MSDYNRFVTHYFQNHTVVCQPIVKNGSRNVLLCYTLGFRLSVLPLVSCFRLSVLESRLLQGLEEEVGAGVRTDVAEDQRRTRRGTTLECRTTSKTHLRGRKLLLLTIGPYHIHSGYRYPHPCLRFSTGTQRTPADVHVLGRPQGTVYLPHLS